MSESEIKLNSVEAVTLLAKGDIKEIQRLRGNLRFFNNALQNKISLNHAANQMVDDIDKTLALQGKPRNHGPHVDRLEATIDQIKDSLDYFVSLYVSDCAEQDRQEKQRGEL